MSCTARGKSDKKNRKKYQNQGTSEKKTRTKVWVKSKRLSRESWQNRQTYRAPNLTFPPFSFWASLGCSTRSRSRSAGTTWLVAQLDEIFISPPRHQRIIAQQCARYYLACSNIFSTVDYSLICVEGNREPLPVAVLFIITSTGVISKAEKKDEKGEWERRVYNLMDDAANDKQEHPEICAAASYYLTHSPTILRNLCRQPALALFFL